MVPCSPSAVPFWVSQAAKGSIYVYIDAYIYMYIHIHTYIYICICCKFYKVGGPFRGCPCNQGPTTWGPDWVPDFWKIPHCT